MGSVVGHRGDAERVIRSLRVDMRETTRVLGWLPPLSVGEGMRRAVKKK